MTDFDLANSILPMDHEGNNVQPAAIELDHEILASMNPSERPQVKFSGMDKPRKPPKSPRAPRAAL